MASQSSSRAATTPYKRRYTSKKRQAAYRAPAKKYKATSNKASYYRKREVAKRLEVTIPECSIHYIDSLFDPFATQAGVCIPCDLFPLPSQKIKTTFRGVCNLGTTGYGFVSVNPSVCNDIVAVRTSTSLSVGGSSTGLSAFTNQGTGMFSMLPYSSADLSNNVLQARVVACGLRVRYSGAEQTRSGLYVACEEQDMQNLLALDFNRIKDIPNAYTTRPSGDGSWDSIVCYSGPIMPQHIEFSSYVHPLHIGVNNAPMVVVMQGAPNDSIEIEISTHIEYIGTKIQGKTPSHADPSTYGKIMETTKSLAAIKPVAPEEGPSAFQKFIKGVVDAAPKLVNLAVGIGQSIATENPMPAIAAGMNALSIAFGDSGGTKALTYDRPPSMSVPPYRYSALQRSIMA